MIRQHERLKSISMVRTMYTYNVSWFLIALFSAVLSCGAVALPGPVESPITQEKNQEAIQELVSMLADPKVQEIFEAKRIQHTENLDSKKAQVAYKDEQKKRIDFYNDYFIKYYPKALVMCHQLFVQMSPSEIENALQVIIDTLCMDPWLYFVNHPKGFKITHYWEHVVDQLSLMSEFLNKAQVNIIDQKVYIPVSKDDFLWSYPFIKRSPEEINRMKNIRSLTSCLSGTGKTVLHDFYALAFDYVGKLFLEGILLQDLNQAVMYLSELDILYDKLRGSDHERDYVSEAMKSFRELLAILKHKLRTERVDNDDDIMAEDRGRASWMDR